MIYDIVIIGSGPAGLDIAFKAKKIGKSICIIEKDELGGICLNSGCMPTKTLVNASKKFKDLSNLKRIGISLENPKFDYPTFKTFQKSVIARLKKGIENSINLHKITLIKGRGFVKSKNIIEIYSADNKKINEVEFKNLVIAIGSSPIVPKDWLGIKNLINPQQFWELENPPKNIAIIGGGVIGVEYASMLADLGYKISVFEKMDRLVLTEEPEISQAILENLKSKDVEISLNTEVDIKNINADLIICAMGRKRNLEAVIEDLKKHTICHSVCHSERSEESKITDLQIAENIFLAGDIANGPQLAHKAYYDASKVFELMQGKNIELDYAKDIPSVIFTNPEVSRAGFTKKDAENHFKTEIKQLRVNFAENGKAITENATKGFLLMNYKADDLKIVGISMFGYNVSEMNAIAQLIIQNNMSVFDLDKIVFSHPTVSEIFKTAMHKI